MRWDKMKEWKWGEDALDATEVAVVYVIWTPEAAMTTNQCSTCFFDFSVVFAWVIALFLRFSSDSTRNLLYQTWIECSRD
jgi:multidrug transporter EmrE-like cation transporter